MTRSNDHWYKHAAAHERDRTDALASWRFVYVYFSNHTPFDAPDRSEPCPGGWRIRAGIAGP